MKPEAPAVRRVLLALQSTAVGGMETHVIDLAGEYARRGLQVSLIVPEAPAFDTVAERSTRAGARVIRLDTDARGGRLAQARRGLALLRTLRAARPDVVHLHTGGATGGLGLVAGARLCSRATVAVTEHDVPADHPRLRQRVTRRLLDYGSHTVIAVSRRNAALRRATLGVRDSGFAAVLNGVPLPAEDAAERARNRAAVRASLGLEPGEVVLGSLVRLAPGKGLDTLLRAFARLPQDRPARLLLVGDGPLRGDLDALAGELGVRDRVIFAGNQDRPGPFLDAMDVFVLAVPAGSMSIALLEAMSRGLPPVITFGGPEEAVIDGITGLTPAPGDPDALADALGRLVADADLRGTLARAAEAHVRCNFSVARVADDLLDAYAGGRRGRLPARLRADAPPNPRPGERAGE